MRRSARCLRKPFMGSHWSRRARTARLSQTADTVTPSASQAISQPAPSLHTIGERASARSAHPKLAPPPSPQGLLPLTHRRHRQPTEEGERGQQQLPPLFACKNIYWCGCRTAATDGEARGAFVRPRSFIRHPPAAAPSEKPSREASSDESALN